MNQIVLTPPKKDPVKVSSSANVFSVTSRAEQDCLMHYKSVVHVNMPSSDLRGDQSYDEGNCNSELDRQQKIEGEGNKYMFILRKKGEVDKPSVRGKSVH